MIEPHTETPTPPRLSDNAAKRIAILAAKQEKPGAMLRIVVEGGGCSGFQYRYDFPVYESVNDPNNAEGKPVDTVIRHGDAVLLVDSISLQFMQGVVVDYVETLGSAAFEIKNPNVTARCGCGNSFAV